MNKFVLCSMLVHYSRQDLIDLVFLVIANNSDMCTHIHSSGGDYRSIVFRIDSEFATLLKLQQPELYSVMHISYISDEQKNKYR